MQQPEPTVSRPVQRVLHDLSETIYRYGSTVPVPTPCGAQLRRSVGRYAVGSRVMAQGIDECSPRVVAEVVNAGLHSDRPGVWYVLRELDRRASSLLLPEEALQAVPSQAAQLLWKL
jgi:hypothetical protein